MSFMFKASQLLFQGAVCICGRIYLLVLRFYSKYIDTLSSLLFFLFQIFFLTQK